MLSVRDGGKVLAGRAITLAADGATQNETLLFNAGSAGAKTLQFSIDPLPGEENRDNNFVSRLVMWKRTENEFYMWKASRAGVQIHPPRGTRRPHRQHRFDVAHQRK